MSKRSKTTVSGQIRKVSSASYKAYYGITLIETLMSVGLLGVILIPLLMTSTAYLSTKLLNNRTNSELSQNVNALGAKLNTLAASTTGVNHLTSTTTNLEMRIKTPTGARRIFQYSIIGAPGAQRLREFQGSTGNFTSTAAMRSLNEDSITLVGNTGFVYCNDTTCTVPTNTAAQNQAIARTAETVVFDGNTTTNVVRVRSGVFTRAEPVGLLFNAGDNGRKRTFLPSNTLTLGTDPVLANGGGGTILPNPAIATNTDPDGLINVFTKAQVYGTPMGGGAVDADLRLATGSDSSFTALHLALPGSEPPIPAALPVAPSTTQTTRTDFSRIYREGPGTAATGNVRTILPNFQLDQTVADSYQGNMCFSGNRSLDNAFQVYYWNRTMKQAALTSVQNAATPFTSTPECAGASSGYNNDANAGTYYAKSYPRRYWAKPQTYDEYGVQTFHEAKNSWVEPVRRLNSMADEAQYQWRAFDKTAGYTDPYSHPTVSINSPNRTYFYTDGKSGGMKIGWWGWGQAAIIHYFYADPTDYGTITKPKFVALATPPASTPTADGYGTQYLQDQYQTTDQIGLSTLIHKNGNPDIPDVSVDVLDPFVIDPSDPNKVGNYKRVPHERGNRRFNIYGTEGVNRTGDKQSCDFTQNDPNIIASGFDVPRPYRDRNNRPNVWLVCSDLHRRENLQYMQPPNCKITYNGAPPISPVWVQLPLADMSDFKVQGTVSGSTFTVTNYLLDRGDGQGLFPVNNNGFYLDGLSAHAQWAGFASSQTNSTTLVGSTHSVQNIADAWVEDQDLNNGNSCFTNPALTQYYNGNEYDSHGNQPHYYEKIKCNADGTINKTAQILFYNNLNNQGGDSDTDQWTNAEQDADSTWVMHLGGQDAWFSDSTGTQAYISECNIPQTPLFATVDVDGAYFNPAPIAGADTINSTSFTPPYVIRDNSQNYLFYNLIKNGTNQLYSFNPTNQKVVAGPLVNMDWGDVAATRLAAGKRVLSYSPHNKVAVTGNTSGYGNVSAWYYDNVDQPVATLKTGGVGFNAAQANSTNVNYIADPTSTFNAYQTNLTAVTSEGSTLYTLNSVTGTLTRYVTRIGQYNHLRQSETQLTGGIVNASSAIAVSPMDDGLYLLDAGNRTVRYYADRRLGTSLPSPTQGVARSFTTSQATLPTGLAVSKATGLVYVLDSTLGTVTVGTTVTRTLNIHVYNPNGAFIETLALDVSDNQFVNATDRLVPQSGQIMRLTLGEKQSQFYVHVENNARTYQFGVDRQI